MKVNRLSRMHSACKHRRARAVCVLGVCAGGVVSASVAGWWWRCRSGAGCFSRQWG